MRHYSIIRSIIAAIAAIFSAPEAQAYEFTFAQGFDAHGTVTVSYVEPGETEVMDVTEYFVALEQGETPEGSLPVSEGGTVSVSISPVRGWAVGSVTARTYMYTDEMRTRSGGAPSPSLGIDVDVTNAGNNVYTVTIPTANVELSIAYTKLPEAKITIDSDSKTPDQLAENDEFTATIGEMEYAPDEVNINYTLLIMNGITVNATVSATFVSLSGNKATYRVTGNRASKLTFGDVEWKESGALMTRPSNITFSWADVDTSRLRFTNIGSLTANSSMTLVSDFGDSVGTITGSKYMVGTAFEGEGGARLEGSDLRFKAKTDAGLPALQEQTHNTVMGGMTPNCAVLFTGCDVVLDAASGLGLSSPDGTDGVATFSNLGGSASRYETGCRRMARGVSAAARPFFSITYTGARIMCKAEDVALRSAEARGNTRSVEQVITIESGKTYDIMTDEDLVLTLKLSEGNILITSIILKTPDPNDLDGSGKVDAVDLVKAIAAGKTQAEINEIVNAIMQK